MLKILVFAFVLLVQHPVLAGSIRDIACKTCGGTEPGEDCPATIKTDPRRQLKLTPGDN
jgi:hypothetical protein